MNGVYVLFYREEGAGNHYSLMQRQLSTFGYQPIVIDRQQSLHMALRRFAGLPWIWLVPSGGDPLDEFVHPDPPVVYAIGSDNDGFGLHREPGVCVTIRTRDPARPLWAADVLPLLCYDRWVKRREWRA